MKQARLERYRQLQRQFHRTHQWRLSNGGLFIPYLYEGTEPDSLSWWDDVGFILNGRRIMVGWRHPRHVYFGEIERRAFKEAGDDPRDNWLFDTSSPNYLKVGRSRKKILSYTSHQPSAEQRQYYDTVNSKVERLKAEGIDFNVAASWKWERLTWADGIALVAPLEVRNEAELAEVAALARRLLLGQTTLAREFPDFLYGHADWLREDHSQAGPRA
jgi:hypothetical protein